MSENTRPFRHVLPFALALFVPAAHAQIATDGSVGAATTLSGPNFQILETLGRREGNNLFHSFRDFNLATGQSAAFLGSANLSNIIARVTGGNPSQINGRISMVGPTGADLWLINPAGWMFGTGASLDLPGSVYVSTASALQLGGGGRFESSTQRPSTFTSSPPEAFVFGATPAGVRVQDATLSVRAGRTIGIAAGPINLETGVLSASAGRIDLAAVASVGTVTRSASGLDLSAGQTGADVRLSRSADQVTRGINNLDVSSTATDAVPGVVRIRGGQLIASSAGIVADHRSSANGGLIDIGLQQGLAATGDTFISGITRANGRGPDIRINAANVELAGNSAVRTDTRVSGQGGTVSINAGNITLRDFATIESTVIGSGQGGLIDLRATAALEVRDSAAIRTRATLGSGSAGSIALSADRISIRNLGTLQSSTSPQSTGNGGSLSLTARQIDIVGTGQGQPGDSTLVSTEARGSGNGGVLSFTAQDITISGRSLVSSSSEGAGNAGDVVIHADRLRIDEGSIVRSNARGDGLGGDVELAADQIDLVDATVSADASGRGNAGRLSVAATDLRMERSAISTSAATSDGGDIGVAVTRDLFLTDSHISTSVRSGVGNGGNIALAEPELLLLRNSFIQANAFGGNGGNVDIRSGPLVASSTSLIEASSQLGLQGTVFLDVPQIDLAGSLVGANIVVETDRVESLNCGSSLTASGKSTLRSSISNPGDPAKHQEPVARCNK